MIELYLPDLELSLEHRNSLTKILAELDIKVITEKDLTKRNARAIATSAVANTIVGQWLSFINF